MSKVLITGGLGYIGTELVRDLLSNPQIEEIVVYDNLDRSNYSFFLQNEVSNREKIRFIEGDILDSRSIKKALSGIDTLYHLAAKVTTPFANTDAHFFEQVNHWGTAELMDAIEASEVKKVIFTSSVGVYGSGNEELNEDSPLNPSTFYAISKMRGEEQVKRLNKNIKTYIIRCGNVFGFSPAMRFDAVINKFVFDACFKNRIQVHGNGHQSRPFIHISKVSKGLSELYNTDLNPGTYNFIEHKLKILDVVDTLKELIPDLEFMFINQHLSLRSMNVELNSDFNKSVLSGMNKTDFKEEIAEFISRLGFSPAAQKS